MDEVKPIHNEITSDREAESLSVRSWSEGDRLRIVLHGELDLFTRPLLDAELARARYRGFVEVLIDLSGLEFIDIAGLNALLDAYCNAGRHGWEVLLRPGPPAVAHVFDLCGIGDAVRFVEAGAGARSGRALR